MLEELCTNALNQRALCRMHTICVRFFSAILRPYEWEYKNDIFICRSWSKIIFKWSPFVRESSDKTAIAERMVENPGAISLVTHSFGNSMSAMWFHLYIETYCWFLFHLDSRITCEQKNENFVITIKWTTKKYILLKRVDSLQHERVKLIDAKILANFVALKTLFEYLQNILYYLLWMKKKTKKNCILL